MTSFDRNDAHLPDELLQRLAEGARAPEAEGHLASCVECSASLATYQELFVGLDALVDPLPDAVFVSDVMARVETAALAPVHAGRAWVLAALAGAAAVAGALLGWIVSGASAGALLTGVSTRLLGLAKLRVLVGNLVGALPTEAGIAVLVAQVLFLSGVLYGLWRLTRSESPHAATEVA